MDAAVAFDRASFEPEAGLVEAVRTAQVGQVVQVGGVDVDERLKVGRWTHPATDPGVLVREHQLLRLEGPAQRHAVGRRLDRWPRFPLRFELMPTARRRASRPDAMGPQEPAIVVAARQLHEDQKRSHQRGQDDEAPAGPGGNDRVGHEQPDHRLQTVVHHARAESQHGVVERQDSQAHAPGHAKLGAQLQVEEHQRREDHQLAQKRHRKRHRIRQQGLSGVAGHHRRVVQIKARRPDEGGDRGKRLGESRPTSDDFDAW